jgi:hypothetical protein
MGEKLFRHLYPLKDDYKAPLVPSRKASLNLALDTADNEAEDVDKARIGPKIKWSSRKRLLPPLPENYHKVILPFLAVTLTPNTNF